ncbi:MAG: peptidase [Marmoricola sp.]|nr:peptidase [Marmoricola sp.]
MQHTFPTRNRLASRRRPISWCLAVLCTAVVAASPVLLSTAQADNLHNRKKQAHHQVRAALAGFDDASTALVAATQQLQAARGKLAVAQRTLVATQGQLTAAQVIDTEMQAKLVAAESALTVASQQLAAGIAGVHEQRAAIGALAAADYQYGDPNLLRMSAFFNADNVDDLTTQVQTMDNLMSRESSMLDDLRTKQALLQITRDRVSAAKATVADERQAAAVDLARKQALETTAAANRAQVASLVAVQTAAAAKAARLQAEDARILRAAKAREARIKRLILAAARKHRGRGFVGSAGGFLLPPVANSYITSPYGWRIHPIYHYWGLHDGDDFAAGCGVPEVASAAGTVIEEYYDAVWGNRLYIDVGKVNGHEMTLIYNHISSYVAHTGAHVRRGQTVARAGTTGWSTGCHLHFTVMIDGTAVDPQKYM